MSVRINRVYTKVGDSGNTALGNGSRVPKTAPRLGAYAEVDETNSVIGVALALGGIHGELADVLGKVQNDLFDVGADLCTPVVTESAEPAGGAVAPLRVTEAYIERLESWCDEFNERLPKLNSFILPGGTPAGAYLHQARTVARRAERAGWALLESEAEHSNDLAVKYLNRLSDLLFILARLANPDGDVLWQPGGSES